MMKLRCWVWLSLFVVRWTTRQICVFFWVLFRHPLLEGFPAEGIALSQTARFHGPEGVDRHQYERYQHDLNMPYTGKK